MAKRRKITSPKKDTKAASIIVGLFAAVIILFFIFSKSKEHQPQQPSPEINEAVEISRPVEVNNPIEPIHKVYVRHPNENLEHVTGSGDKIAFIIDDWGQSMANCKYLKEIPDPLAVSILPGLRHTKDIANCAKINHKLTMLHLPLEALHNHDFYPPNYIIKTTMDPALVSKIVEADMDQLPSIEGVNNHMGSKATESRSLMSIIFKRIKKRGLFFVDSMTASHTVCGALADEMGLSFGKRDVFLDNVNTRDAITRQVMVLAQKAHHKGYAVAIGHDRHLTMQVLAEEIPWLKKQGFQIVSIKELLENR